MTFNQLLYFQTVSKYENYHKAAEKLYLFAAILEQSHFLARERTWRDAV